MNDSHTWHQDMTICPELGLALDYSTAALGEDFLKQVEPQMSRAFEAMESLEAGMIANPDENRMVGHYWLRDPQLAPDDDLKQQIERTLESIKTFTGQVHSGAVQPPTTEKFTDLLVIGIGGSALGPQFVADALGDPQTDQLHPHFIDNTDPCGVQRLLDRLDLRLRSCLCVVISKSGSTPETRNGMLLVKHAFEQMGLNFAQHAVAITQEGSRLDQLATSENWLARFPMWDWVGGRTSETSAVGLLPAALQGLDIDAMLQGANTCDQITRQTDMKANPAAMMAAAWFALTNGQGEKDMVVLPYKDQLGLLSRYLQQLIMESLGKENDLEGKTVEQGITVYGNKGSTDQHAYVQQLRDGVVNFFVTFIEVLHDGGVEMEVEPGVTAGDYLRGFCQGTRQALLEKNRFSITLTLQQVDAFRIGVLIALFERAVGLYASLVGINAYHQPGVEAGKKAAAQILDLQRQIMDLIKAEQAPMTAEDVAKKLNVTDRTAQVFRIMQGLAGNDRLKVSTGHLLDPHAEFFCRGG